MLSTFNSIFKKGITVISLTAIIGAGANCSNDRASQSDILIDSSPGLTDSMKEKESGSGTKADSGVSTITTGQKSETAIVSVPKPDTVPIIKKNMPQNKKEILSLDLNIPVTLSHQPINIKIKDKIQQLVRTMDLTRKATILEVTASFKRAPGNSYTVYINTDKPSEDKIAGYMTFFGSELMIKKNPDKESSRTFLFDISKEYDLKIMKDNLKLLIVNESGNPVNEITLTKIRLETRDF